MNKWYLFIVGIAVTYAPFSAAFPGMTPSSASSSSGPRTFGLLKRDFATAETTALVPKHLWSNKISLDGQVRYGTKEVVSWLKRAQSFQPKGERQQRDFEVMKTTLINSATATQQEYLQALHEIMWRHFTLRRTADTLFGITSEHKKYDVLGVEKTFKQAAHNVQPFSDYVKEFEDIRNRHKQLGFDESYDFDFNTLRLNLDNDQHVSGYHKEENLRRLDETEAELKKHRQRWQDLKSHIDAHTGEDAQYSLLSPKAPCHEQISDLGKTLDRVAQRIKVARTFFESGKITDRSFVYPDQVAAAHDAKFMMKHAASPGAAQAEFREKQKALKKTERDQFIINMHPYQVERRRFLGTPEFEQSVFGSSIVHDDVQASLDKEPAIIEAFNARMDEIESLLASQQVARAYQQYNALINLIESHEASLLIKGMIGEKVAALGERVERDYQRSRDRRVMNRALIGGAGVATLVGTIKYVAHRYRHVPDKELDRAVPAPLVGMVRFARWMGRQ